MRLPSSWMALPLVAATALMLFPPVATAQPDRGRSERSNGHRGNDRGNRGNDRGQRVERPGNRGNDRGQRVERPGNRGNDRGQRVERPHDRNRGNGPGNRVERPHDRNRGKGPGDRGDHRRVERPHDRNRGNGPGHRGDHRRVERPRHDDRRHVQRRPGNYDFRNGRYYHRDRRPAASRATYTRHFATRWYHGTRFNYGPRYNPWVVGIRPVARAGGRYQLVTRNVWIPEYTDRVWIDEECVTEFDGAVYCEPGYWEVLTFGGFYEPQNHWVWQPFRRSVHVYY